MADHFSATINLQKELHCILGSHLELDGPQILSLVSSYFNSVSGSLKIIFPEEHHPNNMPRVNIRSLLMCRHKGRRQSTNCLEAGSTVLR